MKYYICLILLATSIEAFNTPISHHNIVARTIFSVQSLSSNDSPIDDASPEIFGAEFRDKKGEKVAYEEEQLYWKGKAYIKRNVNKDKIFKSKEEFNKLRISFILDSVFVSLLGLCAMWMFGSYKDAVSYGSGATLGLGYAILLGN